MYPIPVWLAVAFVALLVAAGIRRIRQRRAHVKPRGVTVDDDAIARIIDHGVLTAAEEEPLDEEEIRSAEEEFWNESWEEPEPYGR